MVTEYMTDDRWRAALEPRLSVLRDADFIEIWLPADDARREELVSLTEAAEQLYPNMSFEVVVRRATLVLRIRHARHFRDVAESIVDKWLSR